MGEIKSAFEKAMERARNLGEESEEERESRKRQAVNVRAEGLARRYLNIPSYQSSDLERDIGRLEETDRKAVASAVASMLLDAVSPSADNERLFQGISLVTDDPARVQRLKGLCSETTRMRANRLSGLEETIGQARRDELKRAGISGSAVCVDVEQTDEWREAIKDVEREFSRRKRELLA